MHVLSRKRILEFCKKHPRAYVSLDHWYRVTKKARWNNFADVRRDFPHADMVGLLTVFNVGGNKYRLVAGIWFEKKKVFIHRIMTHDDYDDDSWKS